MSKTEGPLRTILITCRKVTRTNYEFAEAHRKLFEKRIAESDELYRESVAKIKKRPVPRDLPDIVEKAELGFAAEIGAPLAKEVLDALFLCEFLGGLLGHKEANAFQKGALKELSGAVFDPGLGIFTLLKRVYAVATRTLRDDQNAAELLQSLEAFEEMMIQWLVVQGKMSQGTTFDQAVKEAYGKWIDAS